LDAGQHLALGLRLGLLRADQQEIEDDEDEDERKELDEEIAAATCAACLGPRLGYEHLPLPISVSGLSAAEKRADYSGPHPLCNATAGGIWSPPFGPAGNDGSR